MSDAISWPGIERARVVLCAWLPEHERYMVECMRPGDTEWTICTLVRGQDTREKALSVAAALLRGREIIGEVRREEGDYYQPQFLEAADESVPELLRST